MRVSSLVDAVAETAAGALAHVWPGRGNNPLPESNLRTALTQVAAGLGFQSFSEVPMGGGQQRLDHAGLRGTPQGVTQVIAETKTGATQLCGWVSDFKRIREFDLSKAEVQDAPDLRGSEVVHLSLLWTDRQDATQTIRAELDPAEDGTVRAERPFDVAIDGGETFLFDSELAWGYRIFCLADKRTFGRETLRIPGGGEPLGHEENHPPSSTP